MRWNKHLTVLCKRLSTVLFQLRCLSNVISEYYLRICYYAIFHSVMTYGILLWGGSSHINRVFILQKKAIRILAKTKNTESCRAVFKKYKIMTLISCYIFECLLYIKKQDPQKQNQVHSHDTRNNACLRLPLCRLSRTYDSFINISYKLFNTLPYTLRTLNFKLFRSKLKTLLTCNVFYTIEEFLAFNFNVS